MLKAKKSPLFEAAFSLYCSNLFRRKFNSILVCGLENVQKLKGDSAKLVCANHSSWWDGLLAFQLSRRLGFNSYFMMEEKHLRRYSVFRRLGAFSVVRENPGKAFQSVRYAAELLCSGPNAVWVFPQGEIVPYSARPLEFYKGIEKIAAKAERCEVVSMAFCYQFLDGPKPDILVRMSREDVEEDRHTGLAASLAKSVTGSLDAISEDITQKSFAEYTDIL